MKRLSDLICKAFLLSAISIVCLVGALGVFSAFAAADDDDGKYRDHVSPNGIAFRYLHLPHEERTTITIQWLTSPVVSQIDPAVSVLMPRVVLFGGGAGRDRDELFEEFADLDARTDLSPGLEGVRGYLSVPAETLLDAAELVGQVLQAPSFDQSEIKRQASALAEDAMRMQRGSWNQAFKLSNALRYGGEPVAEYLWTEEPEDFQSVSSEELSTWHARAFTHNHLLVAGAGSAVSEEVGQALDLALGGLPKTAQAESVKLDVRHAEQAFTQRLRVLLVDPNSEKTVLQIISLLPPVDVQLIKPLNLAVGVLGQSEQSRLFRAVRNELRAAYGFGAVQAGLGRDDRSLVMSGEVNPESVEQVLKVIGETFEKFREKGISRLEFPIAKRFYQQRVEGAIESADLAAFFAMRSLVAERTLAYTNGVPQDVKMLKRDEVNAAIERSFEPWALDSTHHVLVVSPRDDVLPGACIITSWDQWRDCLN